MSRPLKRHHRLSIDRAARKGRFEELDQTLTRLSEKGFDVAGVPFRLLDEALFDENDACIGGLHNVAHHTLGGQPQLLRAALADLQNQRDGQLQDLIRDGDAHPMTRFEAMGWATAAAHRAIPGAGPAPIPDMFQFWDSKTPPSDVAQACADWDSVSPKHHCYSEDEARAYIKTHFGATASADFAALWHPAVKSDLFRLYRLEQDGGLYVDADSRPQGQSGQFFKVGGGRVWMSSMTNLPNCVVINGFIAAPPQNALIGALLEHVNANLADPQDRGIFWLSGPGAYTSFLYQNLGTFDVGLLPNAALKARYFRQFDAPYKHTPQNWRVYEHQRGLDNEAGLAVALQHI